MKYSIPRIKILGATLLISLLGVGAADATLITLNYNFTASGFLPGGAPFDPVTGSFSLTFDNSAGIEDSSAITASISLPITGSILFSYNSDFDTLYMGANGTSLGIASGTNDFSFVIQQVSTTPVPQTFFYTNESNMSLAWAATSIVLTPAGGSAVPETSSSLGLLALAVTALGLVRRR